MTPEQMLREFHTAAGLTLPEGPTLDIGAAFVSDQVRQEMLDSEVGELREAVEAGDLAGIADALADIVYVAVGTAVTYGLPFDAILAEVHRSNMTKFLPDGPVINGAGKIVKGPGYEPPRIAEMLAEHAAFEWEGHLLCVACSDAVESLVPARKCRLRAQPAPSAAAAAEAALSGALSALTERLWANKHRQGFNTTDVPVEFCLLYAEVAEAFEAWRGGGDVTAELADALLFTLSVARILGADLGAAVLAKMAVNEAREYVQMPNGLHVQKDGPDA
jgi:NTP pyrophosphatase (non-canonical NTP hydrolase)